MDGISVRLHMDTMNWWLALPTTADALQDALREMGAEDGAFTIDKCRTGFDGKLDDLIVGGDLAAVNYLAARLAELSLVETERLEAIMESPERFGSLTRLIDFTYNKNFYEIYSDVKNTEDLSRHYIFDSGLIQMPREWAEGIDLYAFGINLEYHEPGHYTSCGYLIDTGLEWTPVFEKTGEIPPEYRLGSAEQSKPLAAETGSDRYPKLYFESEETARQRDELDLYRESLTLNMYCAIAIGEAVRKYTDSDSPLLNVNAVDDVLRKYGSERVLAVLAHTVCENTANDFLSWDNKAWAKHLPPLPLSEHARFTADVHPAALDAFINLARKTAQEVEWPASPGQPTPIEVLIHNQEQPAKDGWLKLPADAKALSGLFNRIGVVGPYDEGYILCYFRSPYEGVAGVLSQNDSLDELNMLASYMSDMEDWELAKLQAVLKLDIAEDFDCAADLINLLNDDNFNGFSLIPAANAEELGLYWSKEDPLSFPEGMTHEEFRQYAAVEEKGAFTEWGYVYNRYKELSQEYYDVIPQGYMIVDEALLDAQDGAPGRSARSERDEKPSVMDQLKAARKTPCAPKDKDEQKHKKDKGGPEL